MADEDVVIFDAADLTWTDGPLRNGTLIVGEFTVRIGEDVIEVIPADDALVFPLEAPGVEEVSGEGYTRRSVRWTTVEEGEGDGL